MGYERGPRYLDEMTSALEARRRALRARDEIELLVLKMKFRINAVRAALESPPRDALPDHKDRDKALL